jgi:hypothetical protein
MYGPRASKAPSTINAADLLVAPGNVWIPLNSPSPNDNDANAKQNCPAAQRVQPWEYGPADPADTQAL